MIIHAELIPSAQSIKAILRFQAAKGPRRAATGAIKTPVVHGSVKKIAPAGKLIRFDHKGVWGGRRERRI